MDTPSNSVTVLNHCLVSPQPGKVVSKMQLRLTFFDMMWLYAAPVQRLLFYQLPDITKTNFLEEYVSKLQESLSFTLKTYLPLAGNLIIPSNSDLGLPEILYCIGNSVPMVVAESNVDFCYLTANGAKNCSDFHPLVPEKLTQSVDDSGSFVSSVIAFQVTLFPNAGISIGITNHPAAGDGSTIFRFMRVWAENAKLGEKGANDARYCYQGVMLPFFYRSIIEDPKGVAKIFWTQWNDLGKDDIQSGISTNTYKVRQTFLITGDSMAKLKRLFLAGVVEEGFRLTLFKVACAYVWTCLVKSRGDEDVDGEELEHFVCFAQCRPHLHFLVASNYFGNCLTMCISSGKNRELVGERAIPNGVELIGSAIHRKMSSRDAVVRGAEEWLMDFKKLNMESTVRVDGSPKFNYYNVNFGWGKPIKFEFVSIDKTGAISLGGCRQFKTGTRDIEIGLCLPKTRMDAFAAIFDEGLKSM